MNSGGSQLPSPPLLGGFPPATAAAPAPLSIPHHGEFPASSVISTRSGRTESVASRPNVAIPESLDSSPVVAHGQQQQHHHQQQKQEEQMLQYPASQTELNSGSDGGGDVPHFSQRMKTWAEGDMFRDEASGRVFRCLGDHTSELENFAEGMWEEVVTRPSHSYSTPGGF